MVTEHVLRQACRRLAGTRLQYFASFALEYALWVWLLVAAALLWRQLKRSGHHDRTSERPVERDRRVSLVVVLATIIVNIGYYTLIIGGDHFEYRVYSYLVALLWLSLLWMLNRLQLKPIKSALMFLLLLLLSWPIPWTHWSLTQDRWTEAETRKMFQPVAGEFPPVVRWYAETFDDLQGWLIDHSVCARHQAHKAFCRRQLERYPTRSAESPVPYPIYEVAAVGVAGWVLPKVAIIDVLGLNDYVVARSSAAPDRKRIMAHERTPPSGYLESFPINYAWLEDDRYGFIELETELTAQEIIDNETYWISRVVEGSDPESLTSLTNADIEIFHMNADTLPDIIAVTGSTIYGLINNHNRSFSVVTTDNTPGRYLDFPATAAGSPDEGESPDMAVGFLNDDDFPDLAVAGNKLFTGYGDGSFNAGQTVSFSFVAVSIGDVNHLAADARDDLVVVENDSVAVYLNQGGLNFAKSAEVCLDLEPYDLSSVHTSIDINLDGFVDVVATVAQNTGTDDVTLVTIAGGDGSGGLALLDTIMIDGTAPQVTLVDIDRDHYLDMVLSNASDGKLYIRYNDGSGHFDESDELTVGTGDDLYFALAAEDMDRDGQPDFVSGSAAGENLILSLNDLPDEPVLDDEMFITGYDYVDVSVTNPNGFVISRSVQTVAGSDYYRLQAGGDDAVDVRLYDYNLQYGDYRIVVVEEPDMPSGSTWSMGIGIDGSQRRSVALNYSLSVPDKAAWATPLQPFIFYYTVEEVSSIYPENGKRTSDHQPTFNWSGLVADDPGGTEYQFQLHRYHDFSNPLLIHDVTTSTASEFTPDTPLGTDSVFYWRFLTSSDLGITYTDTSHTFAAYIICCSGRVGDANNNGAHEPTIGDIIAMIDAKFVTGTCDGVIACLLEADINQSGGIDPTCDDITIGDIIILIDYLFITGKDNWDEGYGLGNLPPCM